eukprot:superscaffoldBa00003566_g17237
MEDASSATRPVAAECGTTTHLDSLEEEQDEEAGAATMNNHHRMSSVAHASCEYKIHQACPDKELGLASHTYLVAALKKKSHHLKDLPIPAIDQALTPDRFRLSQSDPPNRTSMSGPPDGRAAVKTPLGWTLQGPSRFPKHCLTTAQCFLKWTLSLPFEHFNQIERLRQLDILQYKSEKIVAQSKEDTKTFRMLEEKTVWVEVDSIQRYTTPLLWKINLPLLEAPKDAVLVKTYEEEICKLLINGYIKIPNTCTEDAKGQVQVAFLAATSRVAPKRKLSWRHRGILSDQFWICFTQNYLLALQTRHKWQENSEDLKVGSVVMLVDPQSP